MLKSYSKLLFLRFSPGMTTSYCLSFNFALLLLINRLIYMYIYVLTENGLVSSFFVVCFNPLWKSKVNVTFCQRAPRALSGFVIPSFPVWSTLWFCISDIVHRVVFMSSIGQVKGLTNYLILNFSLTFEYSLESLL